MADRRGDGGLLVAVAAAIICCGLPFLAVGLAGALSAVGGLAARFWPLVLLGLAGLAWAGVRLARVVRGSRSLDRRRR